MKMNSIPKDRQIIITHTLGTNVAIWSEPDSKFVYANPLADLYEGKWNMMYFENEWIEENEITSWREL